MSTSPVTVPDIEVAASPVQVKSRAGRSLAMMIAQRLVTGIVILFFVSVVIFGATQAVPSDPAASSLGPGATVEQVETLRQQLGLNDPVFTQYREWLGDFIQGDMGTSIVIGEPVSEMLGRPTGNTAILVLLVTIISVVLSILIGVATAMRRDSVGDHSFVVGSIVVASIPSFVIGILLVLFFATSVFNWLPSVSLLEPGQSPLAEPKALILPVTALVAGVVPYLGRLVRASMIDALDSEYVQMARMKGVSNRRIMFRHALPNAIVPAVQGTALAMSYLAGGTVAIEFLFNYPGLGSELVKAVNGSDIPVVQAAVLILAGAIVVFNLIADVLTVFLTPRLRVAS